MKELLEKLTSAGDIVTAAVGALVGIAVRFFLVSAPVSDFPSTSALTGALVAVSLKKATDEWRERRLVRAKATRLRSLIEDDKATRTKEWIIKAGAGKVVPIKAKKHDEASRDDEDDDGDRTPAMEEASDLITELRDFTKRLGNSIRRLDRLIRTIDNRTGNSVGYAKIYNEVWDEYMSPEKPG
jgi:hypothetical protein